MNPMLLLAVQNVQHLTQHAFPHLSEHQMSFEAFCQGITMRTHLACCAVSCRCGFTPSLSWIGLV